MMVLNIQDKRQPMKIYTVSWHEKIELSSIHWKVRSHTISNPELVKLFLDSSKELRDLLFDDRYIWGLQMVEGSPTLPYKKGNKNEN